MIKVPNYNLICLATAEEMTAIYNSEENYWDLTQDVDLRKRFDDIPKYFKNNIVPYFFLTQPGDEAVLNGVCQFAFCTTETDGTAVNALCCMGLDNFVYSFDDGILGLE